MSILGMTVGIFGDKKRVDTVSVTQKSLKTASDSRRIFSGVKTEVDYKNEIKINRERIEEALAALKKIKARLCENTVDVYELIEILAEIKEKKGVLSKAKSFLGDCLVKNVLPNNREENTSFFTKTDEAMDIAAFCINFAQIKITINKNLGVVAASMEEGLDITENGMGKTPLHKRREEKKERALRKIDCNIDEIITKVNELQEKIKYNQIDVQMLKDMKYGQINRLIRRLDSVHNNLNYFIKNEFLTDKQDEVSRLLSKIDEARTLAETFKTEVKVLIVKRKFKVDIE